MEDASATKSTSAKVTEPTLQLLNRCPITYESALNEDTNIIHEAQYVAAINALYQKLWKQRSTIGALTKHHLSLGDQARCTVAHPRQWIRGGFNVCIPIEVKSSQPSEPSGSSGSSGSSGLSGSCQKLILRCAMPHKLAEAKYPGSVDEKMACEVGTYVWMQERCPDIPIPRLYGFGFSNHRHFTHEAYRPLFIRVAYGLRRLFYNVFGYPALLSRYTSHPTTHRLATAYMLLEHVGSETSQMLSNTWDKQRKDPAQRQRLFRGIARLMLSLARIPQPRIASFRFCNDGTTTLTNRPLLCSLMLLENDGTPRIIQKKDTYPCTEPFVTDLFHFYDQRFLSHPNAIFDENDCQGEMAVKVLLRALAHRYIRHDQRNGPFILQLDDFHASNIFVDDKWNITCLIDLEWVCALPVEKLAVPYWLTGRHIDGIRGEHLAEFDKVHEEFMDIFEEEEHKVIAEHGLPLAQIMRETWKSGGVWFWNSITSVNAMYPLFTDHICPRFVPRLSFSQKDLLSKFWSEGASEIIQGKVDAYHTYAEELKRYYSQPSLEESQ